MPVARPESSGARVIAHLDMDCFYVQVECKNTIMAELRFHCFQFSLNNDGQRLNKRENNQRKQPHLRGKPTAVVQYNSWKGGGLIAVSYEAYKYGVKRSMRGDEAKQVCPQIQLVQVPVVSILARKGRCERASIDELYLDLTDAAEAMLAETPPESLEGSTYTHFACQSFQVTKSQKNFLSKSCPLRYGSAKIKEDALNLFQAGLREYLGSHRIKAQGSHYNGTCSIMKYFHGQDQSNCSSTQVNDRFVAEYDILSRTERYPELHTTELPIEFREEETRIRYAMPSLDQQENKGEVSTREDTCETMQSTDDQVISCSLSKQAHDAFIQETSALSSSGTESSLALNPVEPHREFRKEEIRIKNLTHGMRPHDHKRKMVKDKGSSTILRFFQSCNNSFCSPKQEHVRTIDETKASSSSSKLSSSSELIEAELHKKNLLT
ncbi:unnamed protein product [Camellia sinensis]